MKVGDLVIPAAGRGNFGFDYGVGIIIGKTQHSQGLPDRVGYIVQWHHEHQWWDGEELVYVSECKSSPVGV